MKILKRGPMVQALVLLSLFAVGSLQAASILVQNSSFETLAPGVTLGTPLGGTCCYSSANVSGWAWTSTGVGTGLYGQYQPGTSGAGGFTSLDAGATSAWEDGGMFQQTVAVNGVNVAVVAGVTYTLSVDLGYRTDQAFTATADLLINGVAHSINTSTLPTRGGWATYTVTYTGTQIDQGSAITIELKSTGNQANFDNVVLNNNLPVGTPEPATMAIFGSGLLGLVALARRRKTR